MRRSSGDLTGKIPVIVTGSAPLTLRVSTADLARVALDYGDLNTTFSLEDGLTRVNFIPCRDRRRTSWPGALILKDRRPITLAIIDGGARITVPVGRP